jgi:competence protein ComEC
MGGRTALGTALALWTGMLAASASSLGVLAIVAFCGASLVFGAFAARSSGRAGSAALAVALLCAAIARLSASDAVLARGRAVLSSSPGWTRIEGAVLAPADIETGSAVVRIRVERASARLPIASDVRVRLPEGVLADFGERARAFALLTPPEPATNPGGFDALSLARARGLVADGRAVWGERLPARGAGMLAHAIGGRGRRAIERPLAERLSRAARELVVPLVTGDRGGVSPALGSDLRAAGLIHLLALSGLHVAWLAAAARTLCALAGGGVRARALAGAACAAGYLAIAGPLPSLARAALSELILALARCRDRALDPLQALALSASLLLAVAPGWCLDLGFQLSCAATFGLAVFTKALERGRSAIADSIRVRRALRFRPWGPAGAGITAHERGARIRAIARGVSARWRAAHSALSRATLSVLLPTLAAQLAALPILLARFHTLSWPGLVANLLAVPISGGLLASAWIGAIVDVVLPGLGGPFLSACEPLAAAMRAVTDLAARLPGSRLGTGSSAVLAAIALSSVAMLGAALDRDASLAAERRPMPRARVHLSLLGSGLLGAALLAAAFVPALRPPPGRWWLIALDVGQGDALAIATPRGWWLVDTGTRTPHWDAGESVIAPFFRWAAVRTLDTLVLTHDDGDHTGGYDAVRRAFEVRGVLAPAPLPHVAGPAARLGARGIARGDTLSVAPLVRVLWPPRPEEAEAARLSADNPAGVVLELGAGSARALLTADVDSTIESRLEVAPGLAVLKAGHHGSSSSTGRGFLRRVGPRLAIVSCGRRNAFGHPAPDVLLRLEERGAAIRRTDRQGALWLEFGPDEVRTLDWRREPIPPRHGSRFVATKPRD